MKYLTLIFYLSIQGLFAEEDYPILSQLIANSDVVVKGEVTFLIGEIRKDGTFDYAVQFKVKDLFKGEDVQRGVTISLNYRGLTDDEGKSINAPKKGRLFIFFLRREALTDPFNPEEPIILWHPVDRLYGVLESADSVDKKMKHILATKDNNTRQ